MKDSLDILGLMSGSSLDGVDIAHCSFWIENEQYGYRINHAKTYPYPSDWIKALANAPNLMGDQLIELDRKYGHYLGSLINQFIEETGAYAEFVASHGHTIFHQPSKKFTFQMGHGASIAVESGLTVICDLRSTDVGLGGQGAPLVPIGDKLLFPEYEFCLNMGGFSNISYEVNGETIAYDICPVNTVLNMLSGFLGMPYDRNGEIAASGKVDKSLLHGLNKLRFYHSKPPKSLSKEWLNNYFIPSLELHPISVPDKLRTVSEHIAHQMSLALGHIHKGKILVTGGGAFNKFLMDLLAEKMHHELIIPEPELVNHKEALIFAFLGYLRMHNRVNCLSSVTGSKRNNIGGAVYLGSHN